jgi:ureidoglycolate lyase
MPAIKVLPVETPTAAACAPFGWMLGQPDPQAPAPLGFFSPASDFWHAHGFDPGTGGDTEILWVTYRDGSPEIAKFEVHHLTQQAVVPLTGDIIQILALSNADGSPDITTLRAFALSPGVGLCMRPGIWHATRADNATCLMLTRSSTTRDLVDHLIDKRPAAETTISEIAPVRLDQGR